MKKRQVLRVLLTLLGEVPQTLSPCWTTSRAGVTCSSTLGFRVGYLSRKCSPGRSLPFSMGLLAWSWKWEVSVRCQKARIGRPALG